MKKIINSHNAPAAIGPYNHANAAGGFLFVSGQIALSPISGELVTHDIENETRQVLSNLRNILITAGLDLGDVVKCSVFVTDMDNYAAINNVYAEYFSSDTAPARELVQVSALPRGVNIEISAIAAY